MVIAILPRKKPPTNRGNQIPSDIRNFQGNENLTMSDGDDVSFITEETLRARRTSGSGLSMGTDYGQMSPPIILGQV
jgi:hypothetical protein